MADSEQVLVIGNVTDGELPQYASVSLDKPVCRVHLPLRLRVAFFCVSLSSSSFAFPLRLVGQQPRI